MSTNGITFPVKFLGKAIDGVIYNLIEMETQSFQLLAQSSIHCFSLFCFQPIGNLGYQTTCSGETGSGIHTCSQDNHRAGDNRFNGWGRLSIVVVLYGLGGGRIYLGMSAIDFDVWFHF